MWSTEAEFLRDAMRCVPQAVKNPDTTTRVLREVLTGYGRPDLVIVECRPDILASRRRSERLGRLSAVEGYALTYLSARRWVRSETLEGALGVSQSVSRRLLRQLTQRELIWVRGGLVKVRPRDEIMAVRRLWVFEAKLREWKRAADQAERNLWFTRDSYVLLPELSRDVLTRATAECVARGVGLGVFHEGYGFRTVQPPVSSGLINSPVLWAINEQLCEEEGW